MSLDLLIMLGKGAGAVSAVAGAGWSVYRFAVRPVVAWAREVTETNVIVKRELSPNSGSSMRDSISRIELRLIATEARHRASMQHTGIAFWESTADGRCVYASRELLRLTGRTEGEVRGAGWVNMIAPEFRENVEREWAAAVAERREFSMDYAYVRPNGRIVPVHGTAVVMYDTERNVLGFLGAATPVGGEA